MKGEGQPFENTNDFSDFKAQLQAFPPWTRKALDALAEGLAVGDAPPRYAMRLTAAKIDEELRSEPFMRPFQLNPTMASRWRADYRAVADRLVIPAYREIQQFIGDHDGDFRDDDHLGMVHMPDGEEQHERLVRYFSNGMLNGTQMKELATDLFERSVDALQQLRTKIIRGGDASFGDASSELSVFIAAMTSDSKRSSFTSVGDIERWFDRLHIALEEGVAKVFWPEDRAAVPFNLIVQSGSNAANLSGAYEPESVDGRVEGRMFMPVADPQTYRTSRIKCLVAHEYFHHLQTTRQHRATELASDSRYRVYRSDMAHLEGAAQDFQGRFDELGIEETDEERAVRILDDLTVARLMLLDIGINREGWSYREAERRWGEMYGMGTYGNEIARVVTWPGQPLTYHLGREEIERLRRKAQAALGARYRVQDFNHLLIAKGTMPLSILEADVDQMISDASGEVPVTRAT